MSRWTKKEASWGELAVRGHEWSYRLYFGARVGGLLALEDPPRVCLSHGFVSKYQAMESLGPR